MFILRFIILTLIIYSGVFPAINAQIATPSLNPGQNIINPALSSLRKSSAVTLTSSALVQQEYEAKGGASVINNDKSKVKNNFIGYVNANFLLNEAGIEVYYNPESTYSEELGVALLGAPVIESKEIKTSDYAVNLGYLIYEIVAVGLKYYKSEKNTTNKVESTSQEVKIKNEETQLGAGLSFRLYNLFLAYSIDQAEFKEDDNKKRKFNYSNYGVGFSYGDPRQFEFRVEASQRKSEKDTTDDVKENTTTFYALEANLNGFFIGLNRSENKPVLFSDQNITASVSNQVSVGWKKYKSFYALLTFEMIERETTKTQNNLLDRTVKSSNAGLSFGYTF